jgi:hypothetical protein
MIDEITLKGFGAVMMALVIVWGSCGVAILIAWLIGIIKKE